jgi:DNA repair protein SbcD/Mre11
MSHAPSPSRASSRKAADDGAVRFVHAADIHLDAPCRCASDDVRARLRDAGRAAFVRLVDLCLEERVHALLLAGDLFDDERLTFGTEDFLVEQLARLTDAGIHVVATAGNHDPGEPEGRAARIAWPSSRFTLLRGPQPEEVAITSPEGRTLARVVGCGHAHGQVGENLAALLAPFAPAAGKAGAAPVIGLLHARVAEAEGAGRHAGRAPCTLADLAGPGFRYWALGHVHRRQALGPAGGEAPVAHYAGTLMGHDFRETGAHGALLVTVPASGAVGVEFRELAGVRWEVLALPELPELRDLAAVRAAVKDEFLRLRSAAADGGAGLRWMLRLPLAGGSPAAPELQRDDVLEELAEQLTAELAGDGVLSVEVLDAGLVRPVELPPHRGQPHVLGLALEVVDALDTDEDLLRGLQPATLAGCTGTPDEKRGYLRSLLGGLPEAVGEALLKEEVRA